MISRIELFLGFPVGDRMKEITPEMHLFIQDDPHYLQEIRQEGISYLGKFIGNTCSIADLDLFETNIVSLLSKFFPNLSYQKGQLVLLAIADGIKEQRVVPC